MHSRRKVQSRYFCTAFGLDRHQSHEFRSRLLVFPTTAILNRVLAITSLHVVHQEIFLLQYLGNGRLLILRLLGFVLKLNL